MLTVQVIVAATFAIACSALTIGGTASKLDARAASVTCSLGKPANLTTITLDNGAEVLTWACKMSAAEIAADVEREESFKLGTYNTKGLSTRETSLTKREPLNACGINCTTHCLSGGTGGPDPNHCDQLSSGWTSGTFYILAGWIHFYWLDSCQVRVANRMQNDNMTYCWNDLRGVTHYIAWNCQSTQNAHGGYCLMNDVWTIGSVDVNACCV